MKEQFQISSLSKFLNRTYQLEGSIPLMQWIVGRWYISRILWRTMENQLNGCAAAIQVRDVS
jgi:hypothetical protein